MPNLPVPPTPELFDACISVLDKRLVPIYYAELTESAFELLGISSKTHNLRKAAEDVRQWLPKRKHVFYSSDPYYAMAKNEWFIRDQLPLLNVDAFDKPDFLVVPGSVKYGSDGAFEALMRAPYMVAKIKDPTRLNRVRSNGLVLEKHIAGWFEENWPEFYRNPDNHENWEQWCSHDFKLELPFGTWEIDVCGPNSNGGFGKPQKRSTHFHIMAKMTGHNAEIVGVQRGEKYDEYTSPVNSITPTRFVVLLNCLKSGMDYNSFVLGAHAPQSAVAA